MRSNFSSCVRSSGRFLASVAGFAVSGCDATGQDGARAAAYWWYGAQSRQQLSGCLDHVQWDDVAELNTQAARFAQGEFFTCRSESGPFCEQYIERTDAVASKP